MAKGLRITKLRREDPVIVISGKDKGRKGKILEIDKIRNRAIVEKVNMVKKTRRKSQDGPGGITEIEAPIHLSNVMYLENEKPTRLGYKVENGKKVRVSKKTGQAID